ncbi:MAG: recombination protein RecO [Epsilonproteobacteria bacterium]|nr:recombination protein RecO [Campylobacterota bacterium]
MQGYVLNVNKVRDEDLIVTILGENHIHTAYRFYGARHSNINIGYKIDFELEINIKSTIPRLKDVIQLGFPWLLDSKKLYHWQLYIKLFYHHLKDVEEIDDFYIELLNDLVVRITKQNTKRAILESYVKLCEYEGRLHNDFTCLLCDLPIEDDISLVRGFLTTHSVCSYSKNFDIQKITTLFSNKSLIDFDEDEIEYLWGIILQGL